MPLLSNNNRRKYTFLKCLEDTGHEDMKTRKSWQLETNKASQSSFQCCVEPGVSHSWSLWLCSPLSIHFCPRVLGHLNLHSARGPRQLQMTHDPVLPIAMDPCSLSSAFPGEKSIRPHSSLWAGPHHVRHSVRCPTPFPCQLWLQTEHSSPSAISCFGWGRVT